MVDSDTSDTSVRGVREALVELHLKVRLLEDERDYFLALHSATAKAYDRHRQELQGLLLKEREFFLKRRNDIEKDFNETRSENEKIAMTIAEKRDRMERDAALQIDTERIDRDKRRIELRKLLGDANARAQAAERDLTDTKGVRLRLERDIRAALARLEEISRASEAVRTYLRRQQSSEEAGFSRVAKPFVPGGKTSDNKAYLPATHNLPALIQTIENRNFLDPQRLAVSDETEKLCDSLENEISNLRVEYQALAQSLRREESKGLIGDSMSTAEISKKMRSVLDQIDTKKQQICCLKDAQRKRMRGDGGTVNEYLKEAVKENCATEKLYIELINLIRAPSV